MFAPQWFHQLQRSLFPLSSSKCRNARRRPPAHHRVRPCLEALEDRLAPTADPVLVSAGSISTPFSENQQNVTLTATLTDDTNPNTPVNEGAVSFTVTDSSGKQIGTAQSSTINNGKASGSVTLPAGEAVGNYKIAVSYTDSQGTFADDGKDNPGTLSVTPTNVLVKGNDTSVTFSTTTQQVALSASVTDPNDSKDIVNEGTVDFKVTDSSGKQIGTAQGTVSNGTANGSFTLPGGEAAGQYAIGVVYNDSRGNFSDNRTDTSGKLTVGGAGTTISASNATASFSTSSQNVTLTATVTSGAQTVNEGNVTFTLVDSNGNTIGAATTGALTNGSASVSYALPAGTAVGSYTIDASYSDGAGNFDSSFDSTHTLTINVANSTSLGLTTIKINPNVVNGTAQMTLTAHVSNPSGTVNEGVLSFTLAGVTSHANVVNGTASVQLTVPFQNLAGAFKVALSYTDNAASAAFANSNATLSVSTNVWNGLLPANLTFDASNNETMQFTVANQPLFGASYSSSNGGLLSEISIGSSSMPVTYTTTGNSVVASIGNVPWGVILFNLQGQFVGTAGVVLSADGTPMWMIFDTNNQPVAELPYDG
jgi:hypothetical protein